MITVYIMDHQRVFSGERVVDENDPLPTPCVLDPPPETNGVEVAIRRGSSWEVLSERPPEPPKPVPRKVTALQALQAIDEFGLASDFQTWSDSGDRTFRERAFLNKATYWRRDSEHIEQARVDLGLTHEQVDDMFRLADTFEDT